ncbi:MAG TPA: PP2C family serine/threonine-protein phosphatase, partial [Jatrophihabitans sp.]|nr:PP2C family serine/threonine-protein phosphatase [Jatrophihabitans sp.]
MLTLKYAVRSDRGLVRGNNEDSVYAGPRLLAVADGMGGHAGGEVASKIVIGSVEELDEDRPMADLIGALRRRIDEASAALTHAVEQDPALRGMGTTLTAIRFAGSRIALVHVGDSRAYLLRNGQLSQITHDDTYVQSLVDAGKLTAEEASHHPRRSMILRALDGSEVDPDISIREARKGDRYLLCSDGLSDVVTAPTLLEALSAGTPQACADRLIELALRGGGPDNVTCIVADVVEATDGDDVPIVGGAVVDQTQVTPAAANTPAGRAARMSNPEPEAPVTLSGRRSRRRLVLTLLAVLLLLAAAVGGYAWTQKQYFVGKDGNEVAVFRGVNAHFGPVSLYS